ncbi:uncharacterized protein LOC119077236 isoform X1 [Bradysia coprophila]|uniref:uncharacterized protein LOC119077236 isoform X1 n=1 Tax=Bradysia coprophila TaxID=38358 RepID=UPI00187DA1EE|nr:uncharacterized protein LOC119077236 isoform X1 [Bradysia coprophila]
MIVKFGLLLTISCYIIAEVRADVADSDENKNASVSRAFSSGHITAKNDSSFLNSVGNYVSQALREVPADLLDDIERKKDDDKKKKKKKPTVYHINFQQADPHDDYGHQNQHEHGQIALPEHFMGGHHGGKIKHRPQHGLKLKHKHGRSIGDGIPRFGILLGNKVVHLVSKKFKLLQKKCGFILKYIKLALRGHKKGKKKKRKALMKLLLIGAVLKAKIELFLKLFATHLQVKFFIVALIGLFLNIAKFWIDLKRGHSPQKVIYYENAQHQHHYDEHDEGWNSGGGYWKRSFDEQTTESNAPYTHPYSAPFAHRK